MNPELANFADGLGLERRDDGIWFARTSASVSYPPDANAACLQLEDNSFWFQHRNRCIVSLVGRFSPRGVFLDIGGGNGFVSRALSQAGVSCAMLEPGIEGALAARARGVEPVICARIEDIAANPASLAAAGMFDVLEHIEDDIGTLRRVRTLLRPGGSLYLTVPAYQLLFSADDVAAGHFRRYSLTLLTDRLRQAGFRTAYSSYMFAPLPPLVFLLRTLPSWVGVRKGGDRRAQTAEHLPQGLTRRLIDALLNAEADAVASGRSIPLGTSCVVVAANDDAP